jgi:hypothetical protein
MDSRLRGNDGWGGGRRSMVPRRCEERRIKEL